MAIKEAALFGLISAVFSIIRIIVSPNKTSVLQYFISAFISIPVGMICGFLCIDYGLSQGVTFAAVAATALVSENIINVILYVGAKAQKNPKKFIAELKSVVFNQNKGK